MNLNGQNLKIGMADRIDREPRSAELSNNSTELAKSAVISAENELLPCNADVLKGENELSPPIPRSILRHNYDTKNNAKNNSFQIISERAISESNLSGPSSEEHVESFQHISQKLKVVQNYEKQMDDELSLKMHQEIWLVKMFDDGWALGYEPKTKTYGAFPITCCKVHEPSTAFYEVLKGPISKRVSSIGSIQTAMSAALSIESDSLLSNVDVE